MMHVGVEIRPAHPAVPGEAPHDRCESLNQGDKLMSTMPGLRRWRCLATWDGIKISDSGRWLASQVAQAQ